jgi:hypothetical protein
MNLSFLIYIDLNSFSFLFTISSLAKLLLLLKFWIKLLYSFKIIEYTSYEVVVIPNLILLTINSWISWCKVIFSGFKAYETPNILFIISFGFVTYWFLCLW